MLAPYQSLLRSAFVLTSNTSNTRILKSSRIILVHSGVPNVATSTTSGTFRCTDVLTHRLSSSAFQAPEPPVSKGQAVYRNIDLESQVSSYSKQRNSDPNAVFVVTGASRGIGLQLVKTLAARTKGKVFACCRSPNDQDSGIAKYLQSCDKAIRSRVQTVELDIAKQDSIETAASDIKDACNGRVDMLLNVAGILGDGSTTPGPERSIRALDRGWMELSLQTNCIGPVMFSKEIAPLMVQRRGASNKNSNGDRPPIAIIANWSARVGSVSDNNLGGWYSYRLSKAALNQATRTMSHELKRQSVWTIALHPGTTDSDLSKPFQKNVAKERLFPVDFTVDQLLSVLDHMDEHHSGGLYDWAGKAIPF